MTTNNYHTVIIDGNLPETKKYYEIQDREASPSKNYWLNQMEDPEKDTRYKVQYTQSNGPHTSSEENHPIFSAFIRAYNSHEDVVLSPGDLWLMICIYFCQYVNENAEQLRELFVEHEERKRLTIVQVELLEPNWSNFLQRIRVEIGKNVKHDIVNLLTSNFSTTTEVESFLSCISIMDTFQKYFEYRCYLTRCGIRKVHFMGTLDDWNLLKEKTNQLKKFSTGNFAEYIDGLLPIIEKFIETYENKVDNEFWNKIMDIEHVGMGRSGKMPGKYVSGWILKLFFGLNDRNNAEIKQIKLNSFKVPVTVDNEITNESKICYLTGGFHGVDSFDGQHKPVMSLAIIDDLQTIKPFKS